MLLYFECRNEIAYGSSDHLVYIRKFSPEGSQMPLLNTLQHDGEVTALKWNSINKQWVSGTVFLQLVIKQMMHLDWFYNIVLTVA